MFMEISLVRQDLLQRTLHRRRSGVPARPSRKRFLSSFVNEQGRQCPSVKATRQRHGWRPLVCWENGLVLRVPLLMRIIA